jgi:hypothetical protein
MLSIIDISRVQVLKFKMLETWHRERSMTCHSRSRKSLTLHRIKSEDKTGGGYGGGGGKFPFYDSTFNCLVFPSYVRLSGPSVIRSLCRSDSHITTLASGQWALPSVVFACLILRQKSQMNMKDVR